MKRVLKIVAIILGVLIVIVIALPLFVDANLFRPRIESELTSALGRQVHVGNLSLSILKGGVTADDISIADDPAFNKAPFVKAKSLNVGVELIPLIVSKALHVTDVSLHGPEIALVRSENGDKWNFSSLGNNSAAAATGSQPATPAAKTTDQPSGTTPGGNPNLSVAKLKVNDGRVTLSRADSSDKPRVYDKVNIEVRNFSFASSFPFQVTANLPSGGSLKLDGTAGPIDPSNAAHTPLQAKASVKQMDLASSGFIDPASGISGIADFDGNVASDGREAKTTGTLKVVKLQVVQKNGSPAGKPVELKYAVSYALAKQSGNLEAMLPALGVVLPPKSSLKGGTLATNLTIAGPVDKLVTTGTIKLENSALAGFNLGSRLSAISALSGKSAGSNDTSIQNFSSDVHVAPDGTRAENINLTLPAFGVLTGSGTVSPNNALNFKMNANLSGGAVSGVTQMAGLGSKGGGIPFTITGTTSDPKFIPDVKGMAGGMLQQALKGNGTPGATGAQNPLGGLSGMFKKKKKP